MIWLHICTTLMCYAAYVYCRIYDVVADVDPKKNANKSDFSEISRTIRALCAWHEINWNLSDLHDRKKSFSLLNSFESFCLQNESIWSTCMELMNKKTTSMYRSNFEIIHHSMSTKCVRLCVRVDDTVCKMKLPAIERIKKHYLAIEFADKPILKWMKGAKAHAKLPVEMRRLSVYSCVHVICLWQNEYCQFQVFVLFIAFVG